MKKTDFIIVGILLVLMFGWMYFFPSTKKPVSSPEPPVAETGSAQAPAPAGEKAAPALTAPAVKDAADAVAEKVDELLAPEQQLLLSNDQIELTVSSHGGAIVSAVLNDYPELNEPDSPPLTLNFSNAPALCYGGLPLAAGTLTETEDGIVYTASLGDGQLFKRKLALEGEYQLVVEDEFVNTSDVPWALPELRLPTGPMSNPQGTSAMKGITTLGVDTFAPVEGITHWAKQFRKISAGVLEFTTTPQLVTTTPVDWVAAKNKFFVQILIPEQTATGFDFTVRREGEGKKQEASEVSAALQFNKELVGANETVSRTVRAYIGPKDFESLKTLGMNQSEVMEFKSVGFWKFMNPIMYPIKLALLWGLIHLAPFGNYGIAILILTIIVRVLFWPLTHKSTESMKRMQEFQPKIKEIQAKYKDNPQRMQQETMAFYKEHKINPMGGCLPMLIQIPVFIALFRVLRSAIELRFSKFLWIKDLSEPENLFAGTFTVPLVGWDSLNILPILMAATMMWQQKLTTGSAAATPEQQQQQKMMAVMMPIMMLFFFYTMPSGLVLYWTTSQILMIAQLIIRKKKEVRSA
ncbi:membrane protein insertase YidC [Tichowtungia aerotolerans]|uniref:Membrane protein insertase YidC n=1 Tax=Tichowtungia aerotolerans TaxID=2697043 RepID=A0A6P1M6F6_9BACT|nr:membrane protein insertase YidC [Tichowtungia aerotolerans]QHI68184.1 membrane protein insertase YidC [Tichowtungia aerotolerans]